MAQRLKIPLPTHGLQETGVRSLGGEDPLEKEVATQAVFLPGREFHGQWSLAGCDPTTFEMFADIQKQSFLFAPKKHPT